MKHFDGSNVNSFEKQKKKRFETMKTLTRKDELMLLAILRLGNEASLVKLREYLIQKTAKPWSIGNVFVSLDKLEELGYATPRLGEPSAKRGGKAIKFYHVTTDGLKALREVKAVQDGMWEGLYEVVFNE